MSFTSRIMRFKSCPINSSVARAAHDAVALGTKLFHASGIGDSCWPADAAAKVVVVLLANRVPDEKVFLATLLAAFGQGRFDAPSFLPVTETATIFWKATV
jgi:hypothetical protein